MGDGATEAELMRIRGMRDAVIKRISETHGGHGNHSQWIQLDILNNIIEKNAK